MLLGRFSFFDRPSSLCLTSSELLSKFLDVSVLKSVIGFFSQLKVTAIEYHISCTLHITTERKTYIIVLFYIPSFALRGTPQ